MASRRSPELDYENCTAEELPESLENRLEADSGRVKKASFRNLDTKPSFHRFMELPPELRLPVYRELLVTRGYIFQRPQTAILQTCKLVKKEAEDVLYGENEVIVDIDIGTIDKLEVGLPWGWLSCFYDAETPRNISAALELYPVHLTKFRHIKICVVVSQFAPKQEEEQLRFQCRILATFIVQAGFRSVTVDPWWLSRPLSPIHDSTFHALQPLFELRSHIKKVSFLDFLKESAARFPTPQNFCPDEVLAKWFKMEMEARDIVTGLSDKERREAFKVKVERIFRRAHKLKGYDKKIERRVRELSTDLKGLLSEEKMRMTALGTMRPYQVSICSSLQYPMRRCCQYPGAVQVSVWGWLKKKWYGQAAS